MRKNDTMTDSGRDVDVPERLARLLQGVGDGRIVFLTGAGISAESGIPTFRGPEGYWKIGSRNYRPEELATAAAFARMPDEVWAWYLYRRGVCLRAAPNEAHLALAELERAIGDRFLLITQNVDGLHLRAGNTRARTYEIHGDIAFMRCASACSAALYPVPDQIDLSWDKARPVAEAERALLVCPRCGGRSRPHVLWFDESYDEARYRFESSLEAAERADLLVIVGTSGATTLPNHVARIAADRGAMLVVVNAEPSPFSALAERVERGSFVQAAACRAVPSITRLLSGER